MKNQTLFFGFVSLFLIGIIFYACKVQEKSPHDNKNPSKTKLEQLSNFVPTLMRKDNQFRSAFTDNVVWRSTKKSYLNFTFKPNYDFNPNTFFEENKKAFGLGSDDEIRLIKEEGEERVSEFFHIMNGYTYQQYYKGILIQNAKATIFVHSDGKIEFDGRIVENLQISLLNIIAEELALQKTLDTVKAEEYCWENDHYVKLWGDGCDPKIEKFITFKSDYERKKNRFSFNGEEYQLLYKVFVTTIKPFTNFWTHIQAHTGQLLAFRNTEVHQCHPGSVNTVYNGNQSFQIYQLNSSFYKLMDYNCRGEWIIPKTEADWENTSDCPDVDDCVDLQNSTTGWDSNPFRRRKASALWATQKSWDYFENTFSVHGAERLRLIMEKNSCGLSANIMNNETIINIPRDNNSVSGGCPSPLPYTSWNNFVSLESIAHEFTHTIDMVNGNNVALNSLGEDRTIMESLSDIFGAIIEINEFGIDNFDWVIHDEIVSNNALKRSFEGPNNFGYHWVESNGQLSIQTGQPDFYGQANMMNESPIDFYPETGIINHWFYLLVKGGENEVWEDLNGNGFQDANEESNIFSVNSVDISDVEQILMRLFNGQMNERIDVNDIFDDFAQKVLLITQNLYGSNSAIYCSVVSALRAVNLPVNFGSTPTLQDYYIQVNPDDNGNEPYVGSSILWTSEDIYVRNGPDGFENPVHQNPTYDLLNPAELDYVYVKVRNRGCQPITDAKLHVYWSRASTGLEWPIHWRGTNPNINGYFENGVLVGQEMTDLENQYPNQGPIDIDMLMPGEVGTYQVKWQVPNPEAFGDMSLHYCILARIVSNSDPIENEGNNLGVNVINNNNIAWKNVTLMEGIDMLGLIGPGSVWVRKTSPLDDKVTLRIKSDIPYFLNQGKLFTRIVGGGWENWINVSDVESFQPMGDLKAEIKREEVELVFENMAVGERFTLEVYFKPESNFVRPMHLDVIQIESKRIVGGERFTVMPSKKAGVKEEINLANNQLVEKLAVVYPNPVSHNELTIKLNSSTNENIRNVNIRVIDLNNRVLIDEKLTGSRTSTLNVASLSNGVYYVLIEIDDEIFTEKLVVIKH